jgi:hypothetical protein
MLFQLGIVIILFKVDAIFVFIMEISTSLCKYKVEDFRCYLYSTFPFPSVSPAPVLRIYSPPLYPNARNRSTRIG